MYLAHSAQATALLAKNSSSANGDCVLFAVLENLTLGQAVASRTSLDSLIHPTDKLEGIQLSRLDVQLLEHRQVCLILQAHIRAQLISTATSRRF